MIFPVEVRHNQAEESSIVTDSIVNAIAASEVDLEAAIAFTILSVTIKTNFCRVQGLTVIVGCTEHILQ